MARFQPCLFRNNRRLGGNVCGEGVAWGATRGASFAQMSSWISPQLTPRQMHGHKFFRDCSANHFTTPIALGVPALRQIRCQWQSRERQRSHGSGVRLEVRGQSVHYACGLANEWSVHCCCPHRRIDCARRWRRKVSQTTLTATWWWTLGSFAAAAVVELAVTWQFVTDDTTVAALRYAARALLLCPTVSLIGAKRPQAGPWNFVVLSLWGVAALPAAEALFLNTGQPLEIQAFRSWFLAGLIIVSLVNVFPTRHGLAGLLAVTGQTLLLAEYLPIPLAVSPIVTSIVGFGALAVAAMLLR